MRGLRILRWRRLPPIGVLAIPENQGGRGALCPSCVPALYTGTQGPKGLAITGAEGVHTIQWTQGGHGRATGGPTRADGGVPGSIHPPPAGGALQGRQGSRWRVVCPAPRRRFRITQGRLRRFQITQGRLRRLGIVQSALDPPRGAQASPAPLGPAGGPAKSPAGPSGLTGQWAALVGRQGGRGGPGDPMGLT